jgi:hypothetical protein
MPKVTKSPLKFDLEGGYFIFVSDNGNTMGPLP